MIHTNRHNRGVFGARTWATHLARVLFMLLAFAFMPTGTVSFAANAEESVMVVEHYFGAEAAPRATRRHTHRRPPATHVTTVTPPHAPRSTPWQHPTVSRHEYAAWNGTGTPLR